MTNLRYQAVALKLRSQIESERYHDRGLPTELELCKEFEASRSTIRKALGLLREQGWVTSRQGSGWMVNPDRPPSGAVRVRVGTTAGTSPTVSVVAARRRRPPRAIRTDLHEAMARSLIVVERVSEVAGKPVHRSETWFSNVLGDQMSPEEASASAPAKLAAALGSAPGSFDQYVEAVAANDVDARHLGVVRGEPMLQVVRTAYGAASEPLFQSLHRHPGALTKFEVSLPTTDQADGLGVLLVPDRPS